MLRHRAGPQALAAHCCLGRWREWPGLPNEQSSLGHAQTTTSSSGPGARVPEHRCIVFDDSVTLPQADQAAFGPRKGLNLPAAFRFYCLLSVGKTRTTGKLERRCLMTRVNALRARPSIEYLKKLAKQQVAALRKQGQAASLAGAQLTLARKYGFPSWRKLKAHVEALERRAAQCNATAGSEASSATTFNDVMKAITTRDDQALADLLTTTPGVVSRTMPMPSSCC